MRTTRLHYEFWPKCGLPRHVRCWHLADMLPVAYMSAFEGKADIE